MSGALATATILGSMFLYNRMSTLEDKLRAKNERFDKLIEEMEQRTKEFQGVGRGVGGSPASGSDAEADAKISSIQLTLRQLEKMMHQQMGQM